MELKKSVKADLEVKKGFFFQLGLIIALGITLVAFEYKSYDKQAFQDLSGGKMLKLRKR
jgi:periplasmic protein TonB